MKIVKLEAENIKRLVAVAISPDGNVVEITGANGQGKTSVLDAIWWALAGTGNIQESPIRRGQQSARVRLDLGELVVTRTFKATKEGQYTTSVAVENADGARYPTPQTMLDGLLGKLTFDPLAFMRMPPRSQLEALRRFVPNFDFDAVANQQAGDYAKRTDVNRRAKELYAAAASIAVPDNLPPAPVNETELVADIARAGEWNASLESERARRSRLDEEIEDLRKRIEAAMAKLAKLEHDRKTLPPLGAHISVDALVASLNSAKAANAGLAAKADRDGLLERARRLEEEATELTRRMDAREKLKRDAVAGAKLPVDGLGLGDQGVMLNGLPLEQASDAEQLRVSTALAIAGRGKLSVVRIRDGSLLDERSLHLVAAMADEADCQVWIERVDTSGKVGFVIENGVVRDTGEHLGKPKGGKP